MWLEHVPAEARADLLARFLSSNDSKHDGAFFELLLHEMFLQLGCKVDMQPTVGKQTPDFRVSQGGKSIYVEATAVGLTSNPFHPSPNEQDVIDKLNTLKSSDFSLLLDMEGTLKTTIGKSSLAGRVKELLNNNDPDEVKANIAKFGRRAAPFDKIKIGDWTLTVRLEPNRKDGWSGNSDVPIVRGYYPAKRIDPISPVRKPLKKKAKKYRELDAPLVLVVNTLNPYYSAEECDADVLWGNLCIQYETGAHDRTQYVRQPNGFWSSESGGRTNGVLSFQNADMLNVSQVTARLHTNPGNQSSVLPDALFKLTHYVASNGNLIRREGEDLAQLLGVSWK